MALANLIKAALFTPSPEGAWGLPLLLWGPPGIGKTHIIKGICRQYGLPLERLSPGERGEGQFGVVPVPGADGFLHYPAPAWAAKIDKGGVLFVDEINTAAPALQAPLLGLIQLRTLGSHEFGPRVRTIAAANETKDAAGGWNLAPALTNRFGHLDVEGLAAGEWAVSFLGRFAAAPVADGAGFDALAEEARVLAAWGPADAHARGLIAGFVQRRPDLLHKQPAKGSNEKAWPSRRSVDYAAHALAGAIVHGLSAVESDEFVASFVGNAWLGEFARWRHDADLPDAGAVLDGTVKFTHSDARLDRTLAVLGACAALVAPEGAPNRKARAGACWKLLETVIKDAGDCVIPAARVLIGARLIFPVIPEAKPVLSRLQPLLEAAGIVGNAA